MSFKTRNIRKDGLDIHVLQNTATGTEIHLLPKYGALWHAWKVRTGDSTLNLIDNYKNLDELDKDLRVSHKSAKLSPFACRIDAGIYTFEGESYEFQHKFNDGTAIHGLLVDQAFEHIETKISETAIQSVFVGQYRGEDTGYPFDFDCEISYVLSAEDVVTLNTTIKNRSEVDIPVVDGWHPYFKTGSKIDDCLLQFKGKDKIEFNEKLVPTGKLLPFREFDKLRKIGAIELDNAFHYKSEKTESVLQLVDPQQGITISIRNLKNYPILQMYIPPDRNSIAIEPLSGAPDAFNNGMGLTILSSGEEKSFSAGFKAEIAEAGK